MTAELTHENYHELVSYARECESKLMEAEISTPFQTKHIQKLKKDKIEDLLAKAGEKSIGEDEK